MKYFVKFFDRIATGHKVGISVTICYDSNYELLFRRSRTAFDSKCELKCFACNLQTSFNQRYDSKYELHISKLPDCI